MGIKTCRHKGLSELYITGKTAKIDKRLWKTILLMLDHLAGIENLNDCVGVKNLHALKGDKKGIYSMHVTGNICITFRFEQGDVTDLNFEDYH